MSALNLSREFQLRRLVPNLTAGLVAGALVLVVELSFAVLIFSGSLANHVADGIGLVLFGAVIMGIVVALTSSFPGAQAGPQDTSAAILALMATSITQSMPATAASDAVFFTVVAAIALTSVLTGILFLTLGRFKLGNLVRYIPYPVIGGFLAGTGWLIVVGALGAMTGTPFTFSTVGVLFQSDMIVRWLPGVLLAGLLTILLRRYSRFWVMPAILLGAVAVFYAALWLTNTSVATASAQGWLLGPFPAGSVWHALTPAALAQVDWSVIFGQADNIAMILMIAVIALLLNASGLELAVRKDVDLNHELESAGLANLLAGLGGSPAGYHFLAVSVLDYKMGARGRVPGLITAAFCALVLFFGMTLVSLFPKPVLGGLLLFIGLIFLVEWLYEGWFKLSRSDYALVLVILAIIATFGLLQGVIAGLAIAIALFVINYSRVNVIRHTLTGSSLRSTVDRPPSQRQFLREHGEQLWVLQLQAYIFFGTAQRLLDQVRQRVRDPQLPAIHFLIFDFARVDGLDSSAVASFVKMEQFAESKDIELVFTHLSSEIQCQLEQGGLGRGAPSRLRFLPTLDLGVEWCEDQILTIGNALRDEPQDNLEAQLNRIFGTQCDLARFMSYVEKAEIGVGELIVRQGDSADALYFIACGASMVQFEAKDGRTVRLRTMRCGNIFGEVGWYMGQIRTASVRTTEPSILYRLSTEAIQQMEQRDPDIAATLHEWIAHLMAERLAETNNLIAAMMD